MPQQRDLEVLRLLGASRADDEIDNEPRVMDDYRPEHPPHPLADPWCHPRKAIIPKGMRKLRGVLGFSGAPTELRHPTGVPARAPPEPRLHPVSPGFRQRVA